MLEATADGSWWKLNAYTVIIHKLKPSSDLHFSEESLWADGLLYFLLEPMFMRTIFQTKDHSFTHTKST